MDKREDMKERSYDVHGAVQIKLVGKGPVSDAIDETLAFFRSPMKSPDLTIVLGKYPDQGWEPSGTLVGDRFLYDPGSRTTTIFRDRAISGKKRSEVEYVIVGDLRTPGEQVTAYVPGLRKPTTPRESFVGELRRHHGRRALLALSGNPYGMQRVARQAEIVTESIIEPFLFYRLPGKGLSLVHAASVCSQGSATMFAGSANVGKSTLALRLLKEKMAFLGDSLVILSEGGEVLPYPGLVKLHGGHLATLPELADRLTAGMGRVGANLLRSDLSASPDETLRFLPQHRMVDLFPEVAIPRGCRLGVAVLIKRGSFAQSTIEEVDPGSLADALAVELYWGFEGAAWRSDEFVYSSSAAAGRDFVQESATSHTGIREILLKGVSQARCFRVNLPLDAPLQQVEELLSRVRKPG